MRLRPYSIPIKLSLLILGPVFWYFNQTYENSVSILTFSSIETAQSDQGSSRSPAAVSEKARLLSINIECNGPREFTSQEPRVKIRASHCSKSDKLIGAFPQKITVINQANRIQATVFLDRTHFNTDFIALNTGQNPIRIETVYSNHETEIMDLSIFRNIDSEN